MSKAAALMRRILARVEMPAGLEGCWLWLGSLSTHGKHGRIKVDGRVQRVHRVTYTLLRGTWPEDCILRHSCNESRCCNPWHLVPGTARENTQDMLQAGRMHSDMDPSAVREIRSRRAGGESVARLAWDFGISESSVRAIASGQRWGWVE